jgi:CRISPR system Cascade subunit CasE
MSVADQKYFTSATLRRDDQHVAALAKVFMPDEPGDAAFVQHRLLWTLFSKEQFNAPQEAAYLWRRMDGENRFFILGPRPLEASPYFDIETKPYVVNLRAGDRLAFDMRVNAAVNRMVDILKGRDGRKRCDVVMDAIRAHERELGNKSDRAAVRLPIAAIAVKGWLDTQGKQNGFEVDAISLDAYRPFRLVGKTPKNDKPKEDRRWPVIGVCDVKGVVTVREPDTLRHRLLTGFGRAKAFGCGLMLVRRVE